MIKAGQTTVTCFRCGHVNTLGASKCVKCDSRFPNPSDATIDHSAATAMDMSHGIMKRKAMGLSRGTVLDNRYEIIDTLGSGGMGAVFKVFDRRLTRVVALKTIHPHLAATPIMMKRFKQEVLLAQKITHKNVVPPL
jgi:serine/threonine-protein kinase